MTQRTLRGDHCRCSPLTGCGLYFNSTYAFDKHRVGKHGVDRRCLTPAEMIVKGMHLKPNGYWISSIPPLPLGHVRGGEAISPEGQFRCGLRSGRRGESRAMVGEQPRTRSDTHCWGRGALRSRGALRMIADTAPQYPIW